MTKTAKDHIQLFFEGDWTTFGLGDEVPLVDGIFLGKAGSAVVYGGVLVAAWEEVHHIVPHGSPRNWEELEARSTNLDNLVAHITMDSLKVAAKRENLDWDKDCLPRMAKLLELVTMQIEPIHMCMIACRKLKKEIEEGRE